MQANNPMDVFRNEAPEVAGAFDGLIQAVAKRPGLDAKTKQLIYIAMRAVEGDTTAVAAHVPMAKYAGATREEVKESLLMTLVVSGIRGVVHCLPSAMEVYDRC